MKSLVVKRSIFLAGHKTSVSFEDDFWNALKKTLMITVVVPDEGDDAVARE